jgi:threonine synthase
VDLEKPIKRMGVGWTPLVPIQWYDKIFFIKLEYLSPSGSFKDRGVNVMVNQLAMMDAKLLVEDSSGNAGASVAAHSARFGIKSQIYVPAYASPKKIKQIADYGVEVILIEGPRRAAEEAAQAMASSKRAYASHAFNPAYLAGQITAAWEVWEQLGKRAPDWIILPVAQGGQFLGFWFGFKRLLEVGLIEKLPKLIAVQAAKIAPLYHAWKNALDNVPALEATGPTIAEGVAISHPARGARLLEALRDTDGAVLAIEEQKIITAQRILSHQGYYVEPTSALAFAGYLQLSEKIGEEDLVIIPLTGNGLKGEPEYKSA